MKLKKIGHIGIVVRDIEKAKIEYSAIFGIKKWYKVNATSPLELTYGGVKRNCKVTLYLGGKGTTKIELLQSEGEENIYTDFLAANGEGIHHIMYNVKNLDVAIEHCEKMGYKTLQVASFASSGAKIKYAYVGKSNSDTILELMETTIMNFIKKGDLPCELSLGVLTKNYIKL